LVATDVPRADLEYASIRIIVSVRIIASMRFGRHPGGGDTRAVLEAGARQEISRDAWLSLVVIILASLLIALDTTVVNLALPSIIAHFPGHDADWVVTTYLIGLGLSQPGAAWLIDRFGGRRTMIGSLALFTIAAFVGGMAWSFPVLVTARTVQGLAGGSLIPVSLAVVAHAFPPQRRGWVMGVWSTASLVAPALGPLIGGYLLTVVSWRWAFWLNVPLGLVALVFALLWLRDYVEPTRPRLDLVGWFLASVALLALLIAFAQADQWHWLSLRTLCLLVLAAVALWALIAYERRTPSPLLALEAFSSPGFVLTMAIIGLGSIAYLSRLVFVPLQLISLRGLSPLRVGWMLMPAAIGAMCVLVVGGGWIDRRGPRPLILAGSVFLVLSHAALGQLTLHSSYVWISSVMVLQSMGASLVILPATVAALNNLPPRYAGQVAMLRSIVRQVGGAFGVAALSSMLRANVGRLDAANPIDRPAIQQGYNRLFWVMVVVAAITFALALPLRRPVTSRAITT
jgi:EmrB/QacA subfamily drug resistance transporter